MDLHTQLCPLCQSSNIKTYSRYLTKKNGSRHLLKCLDCSNIFSETSNSFLFQLHTPLSRICQILHARLEGLSFNATCRTFHVGTHTLQRWEEKFSDLKETLFLYSITHQFLAQIIEGDEVYTKVNENKKAHESEGWTLVLMERASRFIWDLSCGKREKTLFLEAMQLLADVIQQSEELALVTDGERRYSSTLFSICHELLKTGKAGRPKQVLPQGVSVKLKNKGSQSHKRGPKKRSMRHPNQSTRIQNN